MQSLCLSDTIIAPATAVGEGGIAIVRISGPRALECIEAFFKPSKRVARFQSHRLYHGVVVDACGEDIDEVLATYMAAPCSYTCEDVVEFHCHGSQQVVKKILGEFLHFGLRLARPGEFTYRAFINGRLDLSQAEAVAQLIHAKSEFSRRLALSHVSGQLSQIIHSFTEELREILVFLEAWIDFPEEDLPAENLVQVSSQISSIITQVSKITTTFSCGKVLLDGASILLVGRPNAGKSSLLNSLLGEDRAIVTEVPGTTRDFLEEGLTIAGVPVRLVDTAGLRRSEDPVEREGIRRAEEKLQYADLVLFLVDGSRSVNEEDLYAFHACSKQNTFLVRTKVDLGSVADTSFCSFPEYRVSVKTGIGLDVLRDAMGTYLLGDHLDTSESVMISEQRHYDALVACLGHLRRTLPVLCENCSPEFAAFEIREALFCLGQISGETTTDSILEQIFSRFCIGK
jgi:tRNA modification GTPase